MCWRLKPRLWATLTLRRKARLRGLTDVRRMDYATSEPPHQAGLAAAFMPRTRRVTNLARGPRTLHTTNLARVTPFVTSRAN